VRQELSTFLEHLSSPPWRTSKTNDRQYNDLKKRRTNKTNDRQYNNLKKKKRRTSQTLHRKLNIEQQKPH
jgi:uncharacterized membrane-anchored protein